MRSEEQLRQRIQKKWDSWRQQPDGLAPNTEVEWAYIRVLRSYKSGGKVEDELQRLEKLLVTG